MEHFYKKCNGWFTFPKFYTEIVSRFESGAFLEIGTYAGQSFAYLLVEIINSGKDISLTGIDGFGWQGLKEEFDKNMEPCKGKYHIIKGNSLELAKTIPDNSFDFIFIDANHTYEDVKADILAYLPKVKPNGIISGHDYCSDWPGVIKAVNELFPNANTSKEEVVWWMEKSMI